MAKIKNFLNTNKKYIIAFVVGVVAGAQNLGYVIPDWFRLVLASFGVQ